MSVTVITLCNGVVMTGLNVNVNLSSCDGVTMFEDRNYCALNAIKAWNLQA